MSEEKKSLFHPYTARSFFHAFCERIEAGTYTLKLLSEYEFAGYCQKLNHEFEKMKAQRDKGAELLRLLQMDGGVNNDLEDTINTFLSSLDK